MSHGCLLHLVNSIIPQKNKKFKILQIFPKKPGLPATAPARFRERSAAIIYRKQPYNDTVSGRVFKTSFPFYYTKRIKGFILPKR
jgi:hypothetical protein